MTVRITTRNARFQQWESLLHNRTKRHRLGELVVQGVRPIDLAVAHGVDLGKMTAEIFGRETGLGHGRGGHMHLFDPATHFSCSGIIAEGYPPALGQAFAFQRKGTDRIAVAVTGEGAANQGAFHESLNLAARWSLPIVFVNIPDPVGSGLVASLAGPGGSVTGAPKRAACRLLASLEPVGRGPAMGAFGVIRPGGIDLGLTIRTVGVDDERVHLWAGGGITWGSDPADEVAEADAKAAPIMRALAG